MVTCKFLVEHKLLLYYLHIASILKMSKLFSGEKREMSPIKDLLYRFIEPEMLKPLQLLMIMIFFTNLLSGIPYTPYLISVFDKFQGSFHPAWATVS